MKDVKKDKNGKIISFTISRKTWLRGLGCNLSSLLFTKNSPKFDDSDLLEATLNKCVGKMCCLGSAAIVCGIPKMYIKDVDTPEQIDGSPRLKMGKGFPWLYNYSNGISTDGLLAMKINDDPKLTSREREKKLKDLFKKNSCVVKIIP